MSANGGADNVGTSDQEANRLLRVRKLRVSPDYVTHSGAGVSSSSTRRDGR